MADTEGIEVRTGKRGTTIRFQYRSRECRETLKLPASATLPACPDYSHARIVPAGRFAMFSPKPGAGRQESSTNQSGAHERRRIQFLRPHPFKGLRNQAFFFSLKHLRLRMDVHGC